MGPNSGGGKRNQAKATPTRARFSNFCPHVKSKGGSKDADGQSREKKRQSAPKSGVSASVAGAFDRVSQSLLASADVYHIASTQVADHVISLLSRTNELLELSSSSESDDDARMPTAAAEEELVEKASGPSLDLSLDHDCTIKPSRKGLSDSETCSLQFFAAYGFKKEDLVDISDIVGNDLIDITTAAVVRSCGMNVAACQQCVPSLILEEELVTLASIYGEAFSSQRSSNGCVLSQLTYEASGASAILAIQFSDVYPSDQCNVAAWIYGPLLDRSKCVALCRNALDSVRERCASGLPIIFDVFQTLEEESMALLPAETECHSELQQIYDKYKYSVSLKHAAETTVENAALASVKPSVAPFTEVKQFPETSSSGTGADCASSLSSEVIQSIRIAYNKALNWADESGFSPADASLKAKERLCGLFSQFSEDTILVALSGKSSHSMKPSIAFNIRDLDFGIQLQCTKSIMKSIDVTKGKAKSLLAQAQHNIVEDHGGKIFASSLDEAKQLWVDLSISYYQDQNLARRKQHSESYLFRKGIAARASCVEDASAPSPSNHPVIARSESAFAATASAQATVQRKADLGVAQVSKLFSEQQCVDAVRLHTDRLQQHSTPADKNEFELRKERQVSVRLCDELREKYQSDRYQRMLVSRQQLPAFQQQEKIISDIRNNRVTLVVGDTGSFGRIKTINVQF
jgi:hypothetical protein